MADTVHWVRVVQFTLLLWLIIFLFLPFRTIMIACHIKQMSKEVSPHFSAGDVAKIRNFSQNRSVVRL